MALATFTVTNNGTYLVVTSTTGNVEMISLSEIKDITFLFLASSPGTYPYAGMNLMTVETNGDSADLSFDLAAVTGQAGWTLDQAGCVQCQADITSWTATSANIVSTTDVEIIAVRDNTSGKFYQQVSSWNAGVATITYLSESGAVSTPTGTIQLTDKAIYNNGLLMLPEVTSLISSSTTATGTIPLGSKAATVYIDGVGGSVNGVVRPNGWSQSFEFNNDTLPAIPYDGGGTATVYVDYLT